MDKNLKIVFFGTPEIAAIELEHLVKTGCNVVGVVTNVDKPQGRGKQLMSCEVKRKAEELSLNILQPVSMKDESFLTSLKNLNADVFVVVAFRMMPKIVYSMPPLGTFNLHTSLLPQYRGAAPINWAIINGEKTTGITTFLLNDQIDCGEILLQQEIEITESMNVGELYDIMAEKGKKLIIDTLEMLAKGNFTAIKQDLSKPSKPAPKIFKQDTYINWGQTVENVRNFVRGMAPYPSAKAEFYDFEAKKGYEFKIFEVKTYNESIQTEIGDLWIEDKSKLLVQCSDGIVELLDLQLNGKKRMASSELIKGLRISGILKKK
ncbi:MAG: methionyl-tRNA formyltransferase [Bacteroidales bacterium]|nr:methionyl-tRNA formyltransferase [Bacteroidales bacterium]